MASLQVKNRETKSFLSQLATLNFVINYINLDNMVRGFFYMQKYKNVLVTISLRNEVQKNSGEYNFCKLGTCINTKKARNYLKGSF